MKNIFFAIGLFFSGFALADKAVFEQIAEQAPVGNGEAWVETYDATLSVRRLVPSGLKEISSETSEACGPWYVHSVRLPAIKLIGELEAQLGEGISESLLMKLYKEKKIKTIVGLRSNFRVECTMTWINVYGTDGSVLKLRYSLGD